MDVDGTEPTTPESMVVHEGQHFAVSELRSET